MKIKLTKKMEYFFMNDIDPRTIYFFQYGDKFFRSQYDLTQCTDKEIEEDIETVTTFYKTNLDSINAFMKVVEAKKDIVKLLEA